MGKLDAPLAAVFVHKGHAVIGVDLNERTVRLINQAKAPVFEPVLGNLKESRERLSAMDDYDVDIANTDITFIVVPTQHRLP